MPHDNKYVTDHFHAKRYAHHILRNYLETALKEESDIKFGLNQEHVHKMRVSLRKILTALQVFHEFLNDDIKTSKHFLKKLTKTLGNVRDLDVQLAIAQESLKKTSPKRFLIFLERKHEQARIRLEHMLKSNAYKKATTSLIKLLATEDDTSQSINSIYHRIFKKSIKESIQKFRRWSENLSLNSSAKEFHQVRKLAKKLRYTLEFFEPIYGKTFKNLQKTMSKLQKDLGTINDLQIHKTKLAESLITNSSAEFVSKQATIPKITQLEKNLKKRRIKILADLKALVWKDFLKVLSKDKPTSKIT